MNIDEALEIAETFAEVHANRDIPVSTSADAIGVLAREVRTLREQLGLFRDAGEAAELRIVQLRAGIEEALRLHAGGHEQVGDVLRAALRGA